MSNNETMTQQEARDRIGREIFGNDWISTLSAEEWRILREHGPQKKPLNNGILLDLIKPRPPGLAAKIDAAIGRAERKRLQVNYTVDWMADRRMHYEAAEVTVEEVDWAIAQLREAAAPPAPLATPGRGRRATTGPAVRAAMLKALDAGQMTEAEFTYAKLKTLEEQFGCKTNTAAKMRREVLAELNSRKLAQNEK